MSMMKEFREFAMRGNVVDMAVGIIIGGAFGKIVSSFVNDVLMPPIGMLIGGVDFGQLALTIKAATADTEAVLLNYGSFIQTIVDFAIIAFAIFIAIKVMNRMKREEEKPAEVPKEPELSTQEKLLIEIRDLLARDR
jgi:large conductance mechanosensitive channel